MPDSEHTGERVLRGIPVSAGVCRGKIVVLTRTHEVIPERTISDEEVPQEIGRFEQALIQTRHEIIAVQKKVNDSMGADDARIFDAHLMVLDDPTMLDEVNRLVTVRKLNVEAAYKQATERYIVALSNIDDEYLRERATDLRDVAGRVLNQLMGRSEEDVLKKIKEPCIVIAHDLTPSMTAQLDKKLVLGFGTDIGSKTSHTAIMARSLTIPAVVGLHNASTVLHTGQYVLLDGYNGVIIINPTDATLFEYGQVVRKQFTLQESLRELKDKPAVTLDGVNVTLSANVELASDTENVQSSGAEGVGLFRTEFLFINRDTLPNEEEQYQAYHGVAAALQPQPVIIRTLDLGGDKFLAHLEVAQEMNPFLGWRAIRFCLEEKDIFRQQLRAILRASAVGNVKMMYPMISGLDELNQANALLEECKAELRTEGKPFNENIEVGAMIEIPSAVMIADELAKKVKFFSIGTNDLIQYSLAVDRLNEKIAHLYEPTHPAILRLIKMTVDAAHRNGIWVGVCGEMAGEPVYVPLLLGLGVDELSASSSLVPSVKFLIRRLKMTEARELAEFALKCESGAEIHKRSAELARKMAPSLF